MGLSNFNKYRMSEHAFARYRERFNPSTSDAAITSKVRNWLAQSDFLSKEKFDRQVWFNNEDKVVIVVNPKDFMVITLYSNLEEYTGRPIDTPIVEQIELLKGVNPIVKTMVSDLVKSKVFNVKSQYFSKLAGLYADYAERMDRLSRTTKKEMFVQKSEELEEVKAEIEKIEDEFENVVVSMEFYIEK